MASALTTEEDLCNRSLVELAISEKIVAISDDNTRANACQDFFNVVRDKMLNGFVWNFARKKIVIEHNDNSRFTLLREDGGWTVSASGTGEYYLPASNPKSFKTAPDTVYEDDTAMVAGTIGSLAASEWAFDDNDSLGYKTIYVRLSDDTDPDTKYTADNDYLEGAYDTPAFLWDYALPVPVEALRTNRIIAAYSDMEPAWQFEDYTILYNDTSANVEYIKQVTDISKWHNMFEDAFVYLLASHIAVVLTGSKTYKEDMLAQYRLAVKDAINHDVAEENFRRSKDLSTYRTGTSLQTAGNRGLFSGGASLYNRNGRFR